MKYTSLLYVKLQQLFLGYSLESASGHLDTEVTGLFFDAKLAKPGSVYFAIVGTKSNGHQFISIAIENGASALVVENVKAVPKEFSGAVFKVKSAREALDDIASKYYHQPSQKLFCIGVTGTNGKTSITYILEHILNSQKKLTGVMGTVNHRVGSYIWDSQMTTPDPVTLQSRLFEFVAQGAFAAAMEVSSHALDQNRADSVHFNTVIFTNLTLDHLDYHQTMDNYFAAKQKLFSNLLWKSQKSPLFAIINVDDKYGRKLKIPEHVITWTYGQTESDFYFKIKKMNFGETIFDLHTATEIKEFKIYVPGVHTVYNVVACIAAALTCGITLQECAEALLDFKGIPGRLQKVDASNSQRVVFVDYAHTPDALLNTLQSIRRIQQENRADGRVICVFGCGGDRDKGKRPQMAKIACELSDFVVITSDNPRLEEPQKIIRDIESGIPAGYQKYKSEVDRERAIAWAIQEAKDEDVVLIAGKGHEDYQIVGEEKKYFSDFTIARKYMEK